MTEAIDSELTVVGEYRETGRKVYLRADAAVAFAHLIFQARISDVAINPISGFRTFEYQKLLFQTAIEKCGSEDAAAHWVARPGTSEHHTGLVIDLGDKEYPDCDVEPSFEGIPAFNWLQANATRFGFEMSFPRDNLLGINYEPWHWRFFRTPEAKSIQSPDPASSRSAW